jgi:outer membrane protein assembly factor BamD (BamD/ComL family)
LAAFQKSAQAASQSNSQTATNQPFGKNSQANTAYQNLTSALQSGNLSTAQQAFASLQNDLKSASSASSAQAAHKGHHHHRSSSATDSTASASTLTTTSANTSSTGESSDSTASSGVASDGSLNVFA